MIRKVSQVNIFAYLYCFWYCCLSYKGKLWRLIISRIKDLRLNDTSICRAWTDASFHGDFDNIGCAAIIQKSGERLYAIAKTQDKGHMKDSGDAELVAIAQVLERVGSQMPIEIYSDSTQAIRYVNNIRDGNVSEEIRKAIPDKYIQIIKTHEALNAIWEDRRNHYISMADDFAWYARRDNLEMIEKIARDNDISLSL